MVKYVEMYLDASPVGSGTRRFVVVEERGSRARLLYVPMLRAFWVDARPLLRAKDLPTRGLAARIREKRRERNLLNMPYSGPATRQVLAELREGAKPTPEEEKDDALWGAREVDDETASNQPNEGETDVITDDLNTALDPNRSAGGDAAAAQAAPSAAAAAAKKKAAAAKAAPGAKGKPAAAKGAPAAKPAAKPAAGAAKPAAAVADSKISGKPTPSPNAGAAAAAKDKPAAKTKKAAAGARTKWTGTEKLKLLAKENPSRPGSRLFKFFNELRDGITIKEAQDVMKKKHSVPEPTTSAMLRHMITWGKVKLA